MPNVQLTNEELGYIANAISSAVASAQRAQKTGKSPEITQVYKLHEAHLQEIGAKIIKAANAKA